MCFSLKESDSPVSDVLKIPLHAYKIQRLYAIVSSKVIRVDFAVNMLQRLDNEPEFLGNIFFSDEATFHIRRCVNQHITEFGALKIHVSYKKTFEIFRTSTFGVA